MVLDGTFHNCTYERGTWYSWEWAEMRFSEIYRVISELCFLTWWNVTK